ncbi:VWA domain-containing protein, partial [Acidobacteriota bacterium]
LAAALGRLGPDDRFNIMKFNHTNTLYRPDFQHTDEGSLADAIMWVRQLEASGGTQIYPALVRGLDIVERNDGEHVQRIIFLTDGAVGNEDQVYKTIVERLGDVRLHAIGIGHAPNTYLMRKMANYGRGTCEFISSFDGAQNKIDSFYARLSQPVMTDVTVAWEGIEPEEIYPSRLPDLYMGEPLVVSVRLKSRRLDGRAVLMGHTFFGDITAALHVNGNAPRGSGVATRWARAKVESLMDSLHEGADPQVVRADVIDVGKSFNLVTKYTSLVAVEEFATAEGDAVPAKVANALPAGSKLPHLPKGGTNGPLHLLIALILIVAGFGLGGIARIWRIH